MTTPTSTGPLQTLTIRIAVRAAILGVLYALVAALVILTLDSPRKLPESLLCGAFMGVSFAPAAIVEVLLPRRLPALPRVLLAFSVALLLSLALGLVADLHISYTTSSLGGHSPADAFAGVRTRASDFVSSPRSRLELLAPSVVAMAAVLAARAWPGTTGGARRILWETAIASTVCVAFIAASKAALGTSWDPLPRLTFSLFGVGIAVVSPLFLGLADRLAVWLVTPATPDR